MNLFQSCRNILRCAVFIVPFVVSQTLSTTISFSSQSPECVNPGEKISFDILISEMETGEDLGGFQFDLLYDPSILHFSDYTLSDNLGNLYYEEAYDFGDGLVIPGRLSLGNVSFLDDLSYQMDDFKLATVTFDAFSIGTSKLSLENVTLSNSDGYSLAFSTMEGSASVPESSIVTLFGAGLITLMSTTFIRKKTCLS